MKVNEGLLKFRREIEAIENADIKMFVQNALSMTNPQFFEDEHLVRLTKKVFKIVKHFLDVDEVKEPYRDSFLAACLLNDICYYDVPENLRSLHPQAVREYLKELKPEISSGIWEGIIGLVEGHENNDSSSILSSKLNPMAIAYHLAQVDFIEVHL